MRRPVLLATLLVTSFVPACSEDSVTQDGSPIFPADGGGGTPDAIVNQCEGAELEIGTGSRDFEAVDEGDTIYLWRGPQGGYMFYLSVRAREIDPDDATVCYTETFTTGPETGVVFGEGCWRVKLTNDLGDGRHERVGIWGEVDDRYWNQSYKIRGQDARVDVTISDQNGCAATDGWTIHVHEELGS